MEDQIHEMGPGAYIEIYRERNVELGRLSKSTSCLVPSEGLCLCRQQIPASG